MFVSACTGDSRPPAPAPAVQAAPDQAACPPSGNLGFVCGLKAPEDIVVVPGTRWLIASGMEPGSGLHLVDIQSKTASGVVPGLLPDTSRFSRCAPLDMNTAVLHGLSLRQSGSGRYTLYVTNHGGRESIEVFDVNPESDIPTINWAGCVPMPEQMAANSVAAFTNGTILATVLMLPGATFEDIFAGRNTGAVFMWTPGSSGFQRLTGTDLSGNNGIETSPDDSEYYVASSGSKRIVAFSQNRPTSPLREAQLSEFAPDNLRWVNGQLLTTGMIDDEPACGGAPKKAEDIRCPRGYIAVAIDPKTMAIKEIARGPSAAPYGGTATALLLGNELWLSSFSADRLAYRTLTP